MRQVAKNVLKRLGTLGMVSAPIIEIAIAAKYKWLTTLINTLLIEKRVYRVRHAKI